MHTKIPIETSGVARKTRWLRTAADICGQLIHPLEYLQLQETTLIS